MSEPLHIDHMFEKNRPAMTADERALVWSHIEERLVAPPASPSAPPVRSPYVAYLKTKALLPALLTMVLIVGTGGTVVASESAKPGDALFAIERTVEQIRLAFASDTKSTELRALFANERLAELREILDEEATAGTALALAVTPAPAADADLFATEAAPAADTMATDDSLAFGGGMAKMAMMADVPALEVEAEVFNDVTVVTVEQYGGVTRFTTPFTTRGDIVAAVAAELGLPPSDIDAVLEFSTEDRSSRPAERGSAITTVRGEARVGEAVAAFIDELEGVDEQTRGQLIAEFAHEINLGVSNGPDPMQTGTMPLRLDDRRVELEYDGVRVRLKDGKYEARYNESGTADDTDEDRDNDDEDHSGRGRGGDDEIEFPF